MSERRPTVLSLFSGVGGFDIGLERAGFETVYQCEIDRHARSVLDRHWPDVAKWNDISSLTGDEILRHTSHIDVVAWGSPCQDMSIAGQRSGLNGSKSSLFYEGLRVINEIRRATGGLFPRVSIWENVAGALTSNRGLDFRSVISEMAAAGSHLQEYAVLDSALFGVPQTRRRVFLLSVFDTDIAERCADIVLPVAEVYDRHHATTHAVTEDEIVSFYRVHGKQSIPSVSVSPPLLTVSPVCVASHTMRPRRLTGVEHERLMGWPDGWTETGHDGRVISDQQRVRMCGNGVVAPVATWVGQQIVGYL
jgi:DNA (cytosine-5)-methyltransferase 1